MLPGTLEREDKMISVLLNWFYITVISFPIGFLILSILGEKFHYKYRNFRVYLWGGLAFDTMYAQIFSLFGGVSLVANLVLMALSVLAWGLAFSRIKTAVKEALDQFKKEKTYIKVYKIFILLLGIIATAYGTSRGYMAYDTALYHAQAIEWIEKFGVVKGLGLLHCRFGYNSSSFALSALFSFSFIKGMSLHCVSGYFVMLLFEELTDLASCIPLKRIRMSDFIRIGIAYYYSVALGQVVAPASDFPATALVLYLVLKWAVLVEEREKNSTPYSLLCVLAVFGITLKLSAGLFVLLTIYPVFLMIKKKEWARIPLYLAMGLAIALPFLIRGVLISGWLLYPSTAFDFFQVDWKIPAESAKADMLEIQRWGRNLQYSAIDTPFKIWVKDWFLSQDIIVKAMLVLDVLGLPVAGIYYLVSLFVNKKASGLHAWGFLCAVMYISTIYWFISAPLVRYGYAYVILPFLVSFGYMLSKIKKLFPIIGIGMILFMAYKAFALGKNEINMIKYPYYLFQQNYEEYEVYSYEVDGITFYAPVNGDQTGYLCFPSAPFEFQGELRGEELKDGFTLRKK